MTASEIPVSRNLLRMRSAMSREVIGKSQRGQEKNSYCYHSTIGILGKASCSKAIEDWTYRLQSVTN